MEDGVVRIVGVATVVVAVTLVVIVDVVVAAKFLGRFLGVDPLLPGDLPRPGGFSRCDIAALSLD